MAAFSDLTNTIHVALPSGADPAATKIAFERFGEVARVDLLPEEPPKVAVVFFDVRSAARAIEALGSAYCARGPQTGTRTVRLAGDAKFDSEDFAGISDVQTDMAEEGTFTLQFFDIRDAQRYQGSKALVPEAIRAPACNAAGEGSAVMLPPGLEEGLESMGEVALPPGLEPVGVAPPPGLLTPPGLEEEEDEEEASTKFQCQVTISGLPNKLLSEPMMEAVLQQAGLDSAVVSFTMKSGKPCGEATVTFSCPIIAERCVTHFMDCQWDQSGTEVKTKIVELVGQDEPRRARRKAATWAHSPTETAAFMADCGLYGEAAQGFEDAFACQYMMEMAALSADSSMFLPHEGFSADAAAAFDGPAASGHSELSAEAPAFVPAAGVSEVKVERAGRRRASTLGETCIGSDTSTEVGESEAEDEKSTPRNGLAASAPSVLSAEAPAFVPAARLSKGKVEKAGRRKASESGKKCIGSDTSTEVGESEAEDEKISPKMMASAALL